MNHFITPADTLPTAWVEKIFRKLTLTYGRDFTARWEGQDTSAVIDDWAEELSGFVNWPEAIAWALKNLPEGKPPTVIEFRAMCFKAPKPERPQLPSPAADPVRMKAAMDRLVRRVPTFNTNTDWIHRGLADLASGVKKSPAVQKMILEGARARRIAIPEGVLA